MRLVSTLPHLMLHSALACSESLCQPGMGLSEVRGAVRPLSRATSRTYDDPQIGHWAISSHDRTVVLSWANTRGHLVKWLGSTNPLKRVDCGFDYSGGSPITQTNALPTAFAPHGTVEACTTGPIRPGLLSNRGVRASNHSCGRPVSMPFHAHTSYTPEGTRWLLQIAAFTWRVVPFRFSRAPWIWFREHEVSNPRPS